MRIPELKSLARERRLTGYSRMRKTELVALLQNSPPPAPRTRPPRPTRPPTPPPRMSPSGAPPRGATWELIADRRPRKPSPKEIDNATRRKIHWHRLKEVYEKTRWN